MRSCTLALLLALLSGCGPGAGEDLAQASGAADASAVLAVAGPRAAQSRPVIGFGAEPRYNPVVMYRHYQPLLDYLSAHTQYRFELRPAKTDREAVRALEEGEVDVALLSGVTYLMAHARFGARALVMPLDAGGRPFVHGVFVVREDSPLGALADLRGRSLALCSGYSAAGGLVARTELARIGIVLADLARFAYLRHPDLVIRAVLEGTFDAGAVDEAAADRYRGKGLRILHVSAPVPSAAVTVRPDLPDSVARAISAALVRLDAGDPDQRALMRTWDLGVRQGFTAATDADYDLLRRQVSQIPGGCAQGCHRDREF
ncbi:MAG: PhnD/SsuA/transferrin family substrate-binding protein [Candidatus Latescibacterota bacterium]